MLCYIKQKKNSFELCLPGCLKIKFKKPCKEKYLCLAMEILSMQRGISTSKGRNRNPKTATWTHRGRGQDHDVEVKEETTKSKHHFQESRPCKENNTSHGFWSRSQCHSNSYYFLSEYDVQAPHIVKLAWYCHSLSTPTPWSINYSPLQ